MTVSPLRHVMVGHGGRFQGVCVKSVGRFLIYWRFRSTFLSRHLWYFRSQIGSFPYKIGVKITKLWNHQLALMGILSWLKQESTLQLKWLEVPFYYNPHITGSDLSSPKHALNNQGFWALFNELRILLQPYQLVVPQSPPTSLKTCFFRTPKKRCQKGILREEITHSEWSVRSSWLYILYHPSNIYDLYVCKNTYIVSSESNACNAPPKNPGIRNVECSIKLLFQISMTPVSVTQLHLMDDTRAAAPVWVLSGFFTFGIWFFGTRPKVLIYENESTKHQICCFASLTVCLGDDMRWLKKRPWYHSIIYSPPQLPEEDDKRSGPTSHQNRFFVCRTC